MSWRATRTVLLIILLNLEPSTNDKGTFQINMQLIDQAAITAVDGGIREEEAGPIVAVRGDADWLKDG
jgi:hypothetical protein